MAKRVATDYVERWSGKRIEQQENITQEGDGVAAPRTPGLGVALVRVPEELDSLCVEHSREAAEYYPQEDFEEGERDLKNQDRVFANRAYALNKVRRDLLVARREVDHLSNLEEELWKQLHPVCRCNKLVELRRGKGQNYHYRCRVGEALRHVCYWNGREEWVPYEYCIGAHSANGPVVRREDFDEHGERSDW